ncbi:hypothetical protein JXR93_03040 [bacterium]|nr:hypothetical protein [bacterium]
MLNILKKTLLLMLFIFFIYPVSVFSDEKNSTTTEKEGDVIEIKGESRNFNMKLILKEKKDKITFVKTRRDFREEILSSEP